MTLFAFASAQHGLIVLSKKGKKVLVGNFVALGSMDYSIDLWDLDLVNGVQPCVQLGKIAGQVQLRA
ncbi:hypothetical protein ISN44_As10g010240 [Arabidopsis suecica]|uniref:Uncharacterized protein n=1 Tax=Arabidopsis suecica TaxID=45249 RepID=A0A8T1ZW79_ARASU|nr:hypothetical protein ISN44_As10g010240 [Arabidopsis suecica]